jgi:hypothetical protein
VRSLTSPAFGSIRRVRIDRDGVTSEPVGRTRQREAWETMRVKIKNLKNSCDDSISFVRLVGLSLARAT